MGSPLPGKYPASKSILGALSLALSAGLALLPITPGSGHLQTESSKILGGFQGVSGLSQDGLISSLTWADSALHHNAPRPRRQSGLRSHGPQPWRGPRAPVPRLLPEVQRREARACLSWDLVDEEAALLIYVAELGPGGG